MLSEYIKSLKSNVCNLSQVESSNLHLKADIESTTLLYEGLMEKIIKHNFSLGKIVRGDGEIPTGTCYNNALHGNYLINVEYMETTSTWVFLL